MRNEINKVVLAKLESVLFNNSSNSILRRGNMSARVEMQKNQKPAFETVIRNLNKDTVRNQLTGTPIQQA